MDDSTGTMADTRVQPGPQFVIQYRRGAQHSLNTRKHEVENKPA